MKNSIILENVSADEIYNRFQSLENQITEIKNSFEPKNQDEWLTPEEVAIMLKCHVTTVDNWRKKGKLKKYCIGNRVYYKRSEVEAALIAL